MDAQPKVAMVKRKRRWFQFGLATLLLLTLVFAVVLGLWRASAERQRRAVEYVRSLEGEVRYVGVRGIRAPDWLRRSLGDDYVHSVEWVFLAGTQVSNEGLAHLEGLTALKYLDLDGTRVSDAGLVHLERLTGLRMLDLRGTQVSDAGVAKLRTALPNCEVWADK